GTGLGLSICYGIVTEHGGSIRVKNVPPRGASFRIEIPCHEIPAVKGGDEPAKRPVRDHAKILLVDPEPSVLEAVHAMLKNANHQVFAAQTLQEAQLLLRGREIDLVVSEAEVAGNRRNPGLRDWIVRERPMLADRFIVMTAMAELDEPGNATEGLLLQKPFSADQLLQGIDTVLQRSRESSLR
ncbi:MAG TPA: ATP-binding protein, partial [Candidatus Acidoferrum sp.]|nr:ATP-binding protein [Candidatus Acidoferrum sp.]